MFIFLKKNLLENNHGERYSLPHQILHFHLFLGLGWMNSAALSYTLMAHGHIWLFGAHTAVLSTPCGFMSPPLLGNCIAYWQLALMKQQEFPEGNALLTSIITISSCRASGSMKVTNPPVRLCGRAAEAAPSSPSNTLNQATMCWKQETGILKPIENIYFKCSNFCNPAAWVLEPQQMSDSHLSVQCDHGLCVASIMP